MGGKIKKCEHGIRNDYCKQCKVLGMGGRAICAHIRIKYDCRLCGGSSFCIHDRLKAECKTCKAAGVGGSKICQHGRQRHQCSVCRPLGLYKCYMNSEKKKYEGHIPEKFMTFEEFCSIVKNSCWFCNHTPDQAQGMGVDRIDNSKGHISGNIEACCWLCNKMRGNLSPSDFVAQCLKVVKFRTNPESPAIVQGNESTF